MTRDEVLLKLLSIEPERCDRLLAITGWPPEETRAALRRLEVAGRISSKASVCQWADYRVYAKCEPNPFPAT